MLLRRLSADSLRWQRVQGAPGTVILLNGEKPHCKTAGQKRTDATTLKSEAVHADLDRLTPATSATARLHTFSRTYNTASSQLRNPQPQSHSSASSTRNPKTLKPYNPQNWLPCCEKHCLLVVSAARADLDGASTLERRVAYGGDL